MNGYATTSGHLGDEILLALLDGEITASGEVRGHLTSCAACTGRIDRLRAASGLFAASLPEVQARDLIRPTIRPARWLTYPMIAAASILVVATAAAATTPVREWIIRQLSPHADAPVVVAPPVTPPAKVTPAKGMIASFAATDTLLTVRIDRRQAQGEIELAASTSDRISAQVVANAAAEELVVSPGQLRIMNGPNSIAGYRITIPAAVKTIRVFVGGEEAVAISNAPNLQRRILLKGG